MPVAASRKRDLMDCLIEEQKLQEQEASQQ
jgi:hypothetical protein